MSTSFVGRITIRLFFLECLSKKKVNVFVCSSIRTTNNHSQVWCIIIGRPWIGISASRGFSIARRPCMCVNMTGQKGWISWWIDANDCPSFGDILDLHSDWPRASRWTPIYSANEAMESLLCISLYCLFYLEPDTPSYHKLRRHASLDILKQIKLWTRDSVSFFN